MLRLLPAMASRTNLAQYILLSGVTYWAPVEMLLHVILMEMLIMQWTYKAHNIINIQVEQTVSYMLNK
jgi:hypothetical protein